MDIPAHHQLGWLSLHVAHNDLFLIALCPPGQSSDGFQRPKEGATDSAPGFSECSVKGSG